MTHDEVIRKVRHLYALARSAGEHEALAATKAAERLIQEHRLSEAELHGPETAAAQIARGVLGWTPRSVWRQALMSVLSKRYSCEIIDDNGYVRAYGTQSDLEILRLQYDRIGDIVQYTSTRACAGLGRSYVDSYRKGMVAAIIERIMSEVPQGPTGTAIVRLDQRAEAAKAEMLKNHDVKIVKARPNRVRSDAAERGREAGRRVHLGESMGPSVKGALPGRSG